MTVVKRLFPEPIPKIGCCDRIHGPRRLSIRDNDLTDETSRPFGCGAPFDMSEHSDREEFTDEKVFSTGAVAVEVYLESANRIAI